MEMKVKTKMIQAAKPVSCPNGDIYYRLCCPSPPGRGGSPITCAIYNWKGTKKQISILERGKNTACPQRISGMTLQVFPISNYCNVACVHGDPCCQNNFPSSGLLQCYYRASVEEMMIIGNTAQFLHYKQKPAMS